MLNATNRTIVELKHLQQKFEELAEETTNRTIVELKLKKALLKSFYFQATNRTIVELKPISKNGILPGF